MPLVNWLRSFCFTCSAPGATSRRQPQRFRPAIETLEGRDLPSTLTVLNTNDSGSGSLRATIAASASGDTVVFDQSLQGQMIYLSSGELVIDKDLNIEGPAKNPVAVNAVFSSRDFEIGASVSVTMTHLTILNGQARQGGDLFNAGDLTLDGCDVLGGQAIAGAPGDPGDGMGGGVYNAVGATLTVDDCTFAGDGASGGVFDLTTIGNALGGAIYEAGGTVAISNSVLTSAFAFGGEGGSSRGGAICVAGGSLNVSNCSITGDINSEFSVVQGGAIYQTDGDVGITNTEFDFCGAGGGLIQEGGAVYQAGGILSLRNCQFVNDVVGASADGLSQGGAIYQAGGALYAINCTFADDLVGGGPDSIAEGGAIFVARGSLRLQNCSFIIDAAVGDPPGQGFGGAIYIAGGTVCISKNTTFTGDLASTSNPDVFGTYIIC